MLKRCPLLILCILLMASSGTFAGAANEVDNEDVCRVPSNFPVWSSPEGENQGWFEASTNRIRSILVTEGEADGIRQTIMCTFLVDSDGNISDLFIWSNSGPKKFEEIALNTIRKSAPFLNPPKPLIHNNRILVSFNKGKTVQMQYDTQQYGWDREAEFQALKRRKEVSRH